MVLLMFCPIASAAWLALHLKTENAENVIKGTKLDGKPK